MPDRLFPRRVSWLPLLGLGLVLLAAAGAFLLSRGERAATGWVQHTVRVQLAIARFEEQMVRYESGYRGYMIRPTAVLAADVEDSRTRAYQALATLTAESADNPAQVPRLARLRALLDEKVAIGRFWIAARRDGRVALELERTADRGRAITSEFRAEADAMTAAEEALFEARQREARRLATGISIGLAGAVLLVMVVAVLMVREARTHTREMIASRDAALASEQAALAAIAGREAAEEQLRQIQKMEAVGQLTGGIAHDFNNMLAIVIGSLDLAMRRLEDPERLKRAIANAREGAERAASLTGRLLAFSRQSPLAPVAVDANRLVIGMTELLRRTLGEQIAIETVLAGGLWQTFADPGEIENALLNLAVNARDAMEGGTAPKLTLATANSHFDDAMADERPEVSPGQYVMICVTDTGCGMAPETIARAFDPFFTTKEVGKGTGLGLSQVFGFAKQSGGHAAIHSEPGHGTTVKLYLPRYQGGAAVDEGALRGLADALPEGAAGETVLVCEDEARVRHFSVDALRELGYSAVAAADGEDALRILAEMPAITLLFTDIVMPGMGGRVLADRALGIRPDLKILFTTGYSRDAVVHDGMLEPGVAFLPKPFTITQLARKVRDVLDGRGANRPLA